MAFLVDDPFLPYDETFFPEADGLSPYHGAQGDFFSADPYVEAAQPPPSPPTASTPESDELLEPAAQPTRRIQAGWHDAWDVLVGLITAALAGPGDIAPADPFVVDSVLAARQDAQSGVRSGLWVTVAPNRSVPLPQLESADADTWWLLHAVCGLRGPAAPPSSRSVQPRVENAVTRRAAFREQTRAQNASLTYAALDVYAQRIFDLQTALDRAVAPPPPPPPKRATRPLRFLQWEGTARKWVAAATAAAPPQQKRARVDQDAGPPPHQKRARLDMGPATSTQRVLGEYWLFAANETLDRLL